MLDWTGERFIPGLKGDIELEHLHRYYAVSELVGGLRVLDIACGEGYGSEVLAKNAAGVVGVDISESAITHARAAYALPNLRFEVGSCTNIPLEPGSVDAVVSFETIEHLREHDEALGEFARVLRADGWLCISCPDKLEYSDIPNFHNEYHLRELYANEFRTLLERYFSKVVMYGQRVQYGSMLGPHERAPASFVSFRYEETKLARVSGILRPTYLVAIASNSVCPELPCGSFEPREPLHQTELLAEQRREELTAAYVQIEIQRRDLAAYAQQASALLEHGEQRSEELTAAYAQIEAQRRDLDAYAQQASALLKQHSDLRAEATGARSELTALQGAHAELAAQRLRELQDPRFLARNLFRAMSGRGLHTKVVTQQKRREQDGDGAAGADDK